jgi:NDP-sugar pyrophosphorylase family protein
MGLLEELFPGLSNEVGEFLPEWKDSEEPWSIIGSGRDGIIGQIRRRFGGEKVFIHPTAVIGDNVCIEGPSYIGKGAEIRHGAYLRKGSWICDGVLVGNSSEVKNSILLPGSKIPHFNYVGDSIIGLGANLGAGVKLSNVRNDRREVLLSIGGKRVKSGLSKLGAMIGDGSQVGCNTVINPGAIIPSYSMIGPNETVTGWFEPKS